MNPNKAPVPKLNNHLHHQSTHSNNCTIRLQFRAALDPRDVGQSHLRDSGDQSRLVRSLICFARADGKLLWQKDVPYPHDEQNWSPNWYANASPALDAQRVVVSFASAGLYCFDHDGKEMWKRTDLGHWEHSYGNGSYGIVDQLAKQLAAGWKGSLPSR